MKICSWTAPILENPPQRHIFIYNEISLDVYQEWATITQYSPHGRHCLKHFTQSYPHLSDENTEAQRE